MTQTMELLQKEGALHDLGLGVHGSTRRLGINDPEVLNDDILADQIGKLVVSIVGRRLPSLAELSRLVCRPFRPQGRLTHLGADAEGRRHMGSDAGTDLGILGTGEEQVTVRNEAGAAGLAERSKGSALRVEFGCCSRLLME